MPDTELIPPIGYSSIWTVIGIVLLVLVVLAVLAIAFVRLPGRARSIQPPAPHAFAALKTDYHGRISAIEADFVGGEISARTAHQRLSAVVRSFGRAVSGVDAPVMTLTELQSASLPQVTVAVAEYYPASFEAAAASEISPAVARARQVIESWG
jgi:hypothetical protein